MGIRKYDVIAALALTVGIVGAVSAWMDRPGTVDVPEGHTDPGAYLVTPSTGDEPIATNDGSTLTPVANFEVRGRVLDIERFKPHQSLSNWVPGLRPATHDIGLGFGPMTDTANVKLFKYSHDGSSDGFRALWVKPRDGTTWSDLQRIEGSVTNVHVIPADTNVFESIRRIRNGELVTLRGKLVNFEDAQGRYAKTSLINGDRECEIMWVEAVEIRQL